MTEAVIVALITGGMSLLGVVFSNLRSRRTTEALLDYRIREVQKDVQKLSERVDKHNNLVERMAAVEQSTRSAHHRLDNVEGRMGN